MVAQLLIEKKIISEAEFMKKIAQVRAEYQRVVQNLQEATARVERKDH